MGISRSTTTVLLRLFRSQKTIPFAPITAFPNRATSNFNWVSSYSSSPGCYIGANKGVYWSWIWCWELGEDNIRSLDENGIESLVHVLDLENPDLWKWLSDQEQSPEELNANPLSFSLNCFYEVCTAIRDKVVHKLDRHAAAETRAMHGMQLVRGWDDFKTGRDTPISGNQ